MEAAGIAHIINKDRILVSNPEHYHQIEIRNIIYDDGEGLAGYNGNLIVGYGDGVKDIFYLTLTEVEQNDLDTICDKVEELYGQDNELINLIVFNGNGVIYNLNEDKIESGNMLN